jgi:hypothetical protein
MRVNLVRAFLAIVASSAMISSASSAIVNIPASSDNSIFSDQTSNSNGAGGSFHTGRSGGTGVRHGLISFFLSPADIPPTSTINDVQLKLTLTESASQIPSPETVTVSLFRLTSSWGEGASFTGESSGTGMGILGETDDATWLARFYDKVVPANSTFWTTAGGDYVNSPSASLSVNKLSVTPSANVYTWQSAGMVADVQGWLNNPATNFGWILIGDESVSRTTRRFASRETQLDGFAPTLVVTFTVPEPSTATFAVIGLAVLARRIASSRRTRL